VTVKTSTAPELTAEQVARILVKPLEATSVFLASGPRIFDTTGPLRIPKLGGPVADPGWTGEAELIPERDVDFDEVSLLPSTMKSVKVITRYSNELARQSVIALDAALQSRLVTDVAAKLDTQFFSASGDGTTTPKGMFAWSGTQTMPVGGEMTLDTVLDAWGMALSGNVNTSGLRWFMKPREFIKLRKIKSATGSNAYVLTPDPTQDGVFRLFGAPVTVTPRVPDTTGATPTARAALVDMAQVAVARDLAPSITVLRERYADTDEQALRVVARYDVAPMNSQAVVALTGIAI
jgi:HK97 family phage major capsid protein